MLFLEGAGQIEQGHRRALGLLSRPRPQSYTPPMSTLRIILGTLGIILLIVMVEQLFPKGNALIAVDKPTQEQDCAGTPIYVTYPFEGGMLDPWECKIQCDDKKQRYIVYTNGKATPCAALPDCTDYGEDNSITCVVPGGMKSTTSVTKK